MVAADIAGHTCSSCRRSESLRAQWHKAESGKVGAKHGRVVWSMTPDEAEEIADYIERSSEPHDMARADVGAIRKAISDARSRP